MAKAKVGSCTDRVYELYHDVCNLHMIVRVLAEDIRYAEDLLKIVPMRRLSPLDAGCAEQAFCLSTFD